MAAKMGPFCARRPFVLWVTGGDERGEGREGGGQRRVSNWISMSVKSVLHRLERRMHEPATTTPTTTTDLLLLVAHDDGAEVEEREARHRVVQVGRGRGQVLEVRRVRLGFRDKVVLYLWVDGGGGMRRVGVAQSWPGGRSNRSTTIKRLRPLDRRPTCHTSTLRTTTALH